jgi:hypothetical protein
MEQLWDLSALQANPRDSGSPLFPLSLLQEALGCVENLDWYLIHKNQGVDSEPLSQVMVDRDDLCRKPKL